MFESVTETVSSFVGTAWPARPRGLPKLHPVARLSPRVVRVLGGNPGAFTLQGTNAYLIGTGSRRWLLDTGEGCPAFVANLRARHGGGGVTELEGILLTHWHRDHVGGLARTCGCSPESSNKTEEPREREQTARRVQARAARQGRDCDRRPKRQKRRRRRRRRRRGARAYVDVKDGDVFASVPGATLRALSRPATRRTTCVLCWKRRAPSSPGTAC